MNNTGSILEKKKQYQDFSRQILRSDELKELLKNNMTYRHIARFFVNILLFCTFVTSMLLIWQWNGWLALLLYPVYLYFQALQIAGFMVHCHELSHHHIPRRWLNECLAIISGLMCAMNYYGFKEAHKYHHRNIGNLDQPEIGAPMSLKGQQRILNDDKLNRYGEALYTSSKALWFLLSWPLFIYYGDYNSWLLPFKKNNQWHRLSVISFILFIMVNLSFLMWKPLAYCLIYVLPMLIGGNRVLVITSMHHAHDEAIFFNEEEHHPHNSLMSSTDRDFGRVTNYFMMNNGFHIPHHLHPKIAYYDLPRASELLRERIPDHLTYHYLPNSHFYRDFMEKYYEKRLTDNPLFYQLSYIATPFKDKKFRYSAE